MIDVVDRSKIFKTPLELGGLISVDPLRHFHYGRMWSISRNYVDPDEYMTTDYRTREDNIVEELVKCLSMYELDLKDIEVESEGPDGLSFKIPKIGRSGLIHICNRSSRDMRFLDEVLSGLSFQEITPVFLKC